VSIIGIPVAIAWLPLFPLAAVAAGVLGYLAVARNTGEWLADSDYPWTHWIRKSNTLVTTVGGLVGLTVLYVAANVVSMAPFLRVVTGLLVAAGTLVTVLAVEVGLGAVILTRAGRRRDQWSSYTADEAWEAAMRVEVEDVDVEDVRDGEGKGSPTGAESAKREENDA
jgi:peptidoglycan/LPS O-acetylase OafA/YrhL